jgi:hypothetical protein
MECQIEILHEQVEADKEKRFLQELNGKFKELNIKLEKEFQCYGICLHTAINRNQARVKEKNKTIPNIIYHEVFPTILINPKEAKHLLNNNKKKKRARLIKPPKLEQEKNI